MPSRSDKDEEMRREILALDRGIHDLLMKRTEAVLASSPADETHSPAPLHVSHAARSLRGILARHSGRFPPRALVQIWSDIFFAMDTQTTLHVYGGEDVPRFWDLARTHFGCTMPLIGHTSAMAVVQACVNDSSALGLLPPPESIEGGQAWWEQLAPAGHPGPRIAQCLPFARNDSPSVPLPMGYVIGAIEQESTGTDTSVLRLTCQAEMSRARLQTVLKQTGFEAQILAASRDSAASRLLVANRGFVAADDERLAAVKKIGGDALESVMLVGGFADPFEVVA
ncbi:MAG TPA: hypothetical protein VKR31_10755 [Rhizomicrobium sp.]|nr:hypothetical protein [Rhizomicrobium sp.]